MKSRPVNSAIQQANYSVGSRDWAGTIRARCHQHWQPPCFVREASEMDNGQFQIVVRAIAITFYRHPAQLPTWS
jgi:hypothetical protein